MNLNPNSTLIFAMNSFAGGSQALIFNFSVTEHILLMQTVPESFPDTTS